MKTRFNARLFSGEVLTACLIILSGCSEQKSSEEISLNKRSISDTTTIYPITFDTPSPEGWNAQYKTFVQFPETEKQWAKIIMVQTLRCDSLTKGDKYLCGEWDYIWNTFVEVPKDGSTEQFCLGSFVTPYGKRLKMGGKSGGWG